MNDEKKKDDSAVFWSKGLVWYEELDEFLWALFGGVLFLVLPFTLCVVCYRWLW